MQRQIKCEDPWFTAQLEYYDGPQDFGLALNHAYGKTCVGCNDSSDENYNGEVGSCAKMITSKADEGFKWDVQGDADSEGDSVSKLMSELVCPVDILG
ncbi:hypothetical protein OHC33_001092 [Knufia fluminis]|uniref:Uncharacterized protein n=1 Tax=Knufia fluminis TaxID=191047 RepID=A0AAN8ELB1_9EURO|nr:hypothetical protein OHC33_001092 [Knufia fluminis]